jgi:hypothetical protein
VRKFLCIGLTLVCGMLAVIGFARSISVPIPDTCAPQIQVGNAGDFVIACVGTIPPPPVPAPDPVPKVGVSCPGYGTTRVVPLVWGPPGGGNILAVSGPFDNDTAIVFQFTTPATGSGIGAIAIYEYQGRAAPRTALLSTVPCDTSGITSPVFIARGMYPSFVFNIGGPAPGAVQLKNGTTYYLTAVNRNQGAPSCAGDCRIRAELSKPRGM